MKLTIKITKEVLSRSAMCLSIPWNNCAVAIAVRDIFPHAAVGSDRVLLETAVGGEVLLPPEATSFIKAFDHNTPGKRLLMPEFSFTIDVPDSVIESIGIGQAHEIIAKSSTLELA